MGIPHTRGKIVFNVGEELLRTASQNSRLSRERTQAGWLLIGSIMTLGSGVVKGLLPRMMLLWRNAFPRTAKELESEKARGDGFTWKISIEARAGALASMHSFLQVYTHFFIAVTSVFKATKHVKTFSERARVSQRRYRQTSLGTA